MAGLYIHIPFCVRRCMYCAFYLEPLGRGPLRKRINELEQFDQTPFLDALERELQTLPEGFAPETVYLGGGTPTELSEKDFARLFELLHRYVELGGVQEWTCEANPGTLSDNKIALMKRLGVTRVSLGVQSFNDRILKFLTRIHSGDEAAEAYRRLRAAAFHTVSLDLIFAIPGSIAEELRADVERLIELAPDHCTAYALEYEEGTALVDKTERGFIQSLSDDEAAAQYDVLRHAMTDAGYEHYELFAFARPGFRSRHNHNYWVSGEYFGCGPSAHSHWQGLRWRNAPDLKRYLAGPCRIDEERLDPEAKARETLITVLRRRDGVSAEAFRAITGFDYRDLYEDEIDRLIADGLLEEDGALRLSERSLFISDSVFRELV